MKKTVEVEQTFCDICSNKMSWSNKCIVCGKEFCYDCAKTNTIEYKHAVHFSGSGDGLYCFACDKEAPAKGDALHAAYRKIAALRNEEAGWYSDFKFRADEAEAKLKSLLAEKEAA